MGLVNLGGGSSTPAAGSITRKELSALARSGGWLPTGAIAQTFPRQNRIQDAVTCPTGTLVLMGGIVIPNGVPVASISFISSTTALSVGTHQWFCLVDRSLNVLRKTTNDTSTAWAANTVKTLNLSSSYTPSSDIEVYLGIVQVATTPATVWGVTGSGTVNTVGGAIAGRSTAGLTDPASLGATAAALSPVIGDAIWAYIS